MGHVSAPCATAFIAQLGERQTEDLKVPSSILGEGSVLFEKFARLLRAQTIQKLAQLEDSRAPKRAVPYSLVGQDTWFSPTRPGFDSRWGKLLFFFAVAAAEVIFSEIFWRRRGTKNAPPPAAWPSG